MYQKRFNMDCIKGLKHLIKMGVKADLIITDPPYNINYEGRGKYTTLQGANGIMNDVDNKKMIEESLILSNEVLKNNSHIYIFAKWSHTQDLTKIFKELNWKIKNQLIWVKNNWGVGDLQGAYANQYEVILFAQKGRKILNKVDGIKRHRDVLYYDRVSGKKQLHAHQKPIKLIEFFIKKSSNEGDLILDMYEGIGTTGKAAFTLKRNYIGYEIDPKTFKIGGDNYVY